MIGSSGCLWGGRASQVVLVVKTCLPIQETLKDMGSIPGLGRSLKEGMATHSSILAWRIPGTEEPGELQSIALQSQTWLKWHSMHAHTWGGSKVRKGRGEFCRVKKKVLKTVDLFIVLVAGMVSRVSMYVKTDQTVHLKYVQILYLVRKW